MGFQVSNGILLVRWLQKQSDRSSAQVALLEFVDRLLEDPEGMSRAERRDVPGVPSYVAPIPGTNAFVAYSIIEQFHVVRILDVDDCGFEDIEEFLRSGPPDSDE